MGVRGPKPESNARRRGARVAISPTHAKIADRIKVGTQSRADVVELALEHFEQFLEQMGTIPHGQPPGAQPGNRNSIGQPLALIHKETRL